MNRAATPAAADVLALVGPTASGKTPISILLARTLDAEIISADSRQMYRLMDVGTAKPTAAERGGIPHYFIDDRMPDEECNAATFGARGRELIADIQSRGKVPLVVGGAGLYLRALLDGLFDGPPADDDLKEHLWARCASEGGKTLLEELRGVDPEAAASMLPSNTKRIVRALEVYRLTGVPISRLQKQAAIEVPFRSVYVGLAWDRPALYDRINRRVLKMLDDGLLDEVKALLAQGYPRSLNALQTVGYRETFAFLDGETSAARMTELIQQNSRRYAKRQLTWFRHDPRITWFTLQREEEFPAVAARIARYYRSRNGSGPEVQKVL
jgi:tRNA dimethylallyltransferase